MVKCSEVLLCSDGTSNKVSNIIRSHIRRQYVDNRKLLLICILLLSHSLIFFRFPFHQYMVLFLFNTVMYFYCCLCIVTVRPCILIVVYVFLLLSTYSYVYLLLSTYSYCSSMYSYRCLCILIVVYVFLSLSMYTY